jgi:hypothetical protein
MEVTHCSRCAAPLISLCVCARESAQYFTERALVIGYVCTLFLGFFKYLAVFFKSILLGYVCRVLNI